MLDHDLFGSRESLGEIWEAWDSIELGKVRDWRFLGRLLKIITPYRYSRLSSWCIAYFPFEFCNTGTFQLALSQSRPRLTKIHHDRVVRRQGIGQCGSNVKPDINF